MCVCGGGCGRERSFLSRVSLPRLSAMRDSIKIMLMSTPVQIEPTRSNGNPDDDFDVTIFPRDTTLSFGFQVHFCVVQVVDARTHACTGEQKHANTESIVGC